MAAAVGGSGLFYRGLSSRSNGLIVFLLMFIWFERIMSDTFNKFLMELSLTEISFRTRMPSVSFVMGSLADIAP